MVYDLPILMDGKILVLCIILLLDLYYVKLFRYSDVLHARCHDGFSGLECPALYFH